MSQDKPPEEKESKQTNNSESKIRTIFEEEEIRSTVKAFVLAYIRGTITIDFPEGGELLKGAKERGLKTDSKMAYENVLKLKKQFSKDLLIVSGAKKGTVEEIEHSIETIFYFISLARSSHRIKGTFLEFDIEKKIDDIELKTNATNKVVEQIVAWLIEEDKAG